MRVLVTGSQGLLGSAIRRLSPTARGHHFLFDEHKADLRSAQQTRSLLAEVRPDCIIHCAARVGGVKLNRDAPETMFHDNVLVNANLIHQAAEAGTKKIIAFGSNCSYGDVAELRVDNIHVGEPFPNNRPYAYAKRMLDVQLEAARKQYGIATTYVVPVSMFGPGDNFDLEEAHVIPALIHRCFLARDELPVWGDGSAVREVVYSEDVARIVLDLVDQPVERVVIGSGLFVSVREIAETIARHMQFQGKISFDSTKPAGQRIRPPAARYPFAFLSFDEGIKRTCAWFQENYTRARKSPGGGQFSAASSSGMKSMSS